MAVSQQRLEEARQFLRSLSDKPKQSSGGSVSDIIARARENQRQKQLQLEQKKQQELSQTPSGRLELAGLKKPFTERVKEKAIKRENKILDISQNEPNKFKAGLQIAGEGVGFLKGLGGEVVRSVFRALPDPLEEKIRQGGKFLGGKIGQGFNLARSLEQKVSKQEEKQPAIQRFLGQVNPARQVLKLASPEFASGVKQVGEDVKQLGEKFPTVKAGADIGLTTIDVAGGLAGLKASKKLASGLFETITDATEKTFKNAVKINPVEVVVDITPKKKFLSEKGFIPETERSIKRLFNTETEAKLYENELKLKRPAVQEAVRNGVDLGDANVFASAKSDELPLVKKMQKAFEDKTILKKRDTKSPENIVGEPTVEKFRLLEKQRLIAGKKVGELTKQLPQTSVFDVKSRVFDDLKNAIPDLKLKPSGKLDFSDTTIRLDNAIQKNISIFFDDLDELSPLQLYKQRQALFEELGGKKTVGIVLKDTEDRGLSSIRKSILDILDEASEKAGIGEYKNLSRDYAKIEESLKDWRKLFRGNELLKNDDILSATAGNIARAFSSNRPTRFGILEKLRKLDVLAQQYGYDKNISSSFLQDVYNSLSDYYPVPQRTSIEGIITSGAQKALGGKPTATGLANEAIGKILSKAEITQESTRDAIKKLIDDLSN